MHKKIYIEKQAFQQLIQAYHKQSLQYARKGIGLQSGVEGQKDLHHFYHSQRNRQHNRLEVSM